MIYPVKIYGKQGQFIREVSSEEMLQRIWGDIKKEVKRVMTEDKAGKQKKTNTIVCALCETVVTKLSFNAKFCSHQCAAKVQNNKKKKEREKNRKPRPCKKCGKSKGNRRYCQDPCFSEFTANRQKYIGI